MDPANNAPSLTDWIVAGSAMTTAGLTLLLVFMAYRAWQTAKDTLNASRDASEAARASAEAALRANEQAQRDSIDRTRPYVYARLTPSLAGVGAFDLVISNSGQSAARELTLDFDSWPENGDDVCESLQTMFSTPRTLPPGCSLRVMWRLEAGEGQKLAEGDPKKAGILEDGVISVRYTSDDLFHPGYEEHFAAMSDKSGYWPVPEDSFEPPKRWGDDSDLGLFYALGRTLVRRVGELGR